MTLTFGNKLTPNCVGRLGLRVFFFLDHQSETPLKTGRLFYLTSKIIFWEFGSGVFLRLVKIFYDIIKTNHDLYNHSYTAL